MNYRYQNIPITSNAATGEKYYVNSIYPDISITEDDTYLITTIGDRLDNMALDFYGDSSLWWIIASANSLPGDSIYPPLGVQLRVPGDIQQILNQYRLINTVR
jgi:hypothetical protein